MILKITGRDRETYLENLTKFLNLATLICLRGNIPEPYDIENAESFGNWWFREPKRFQILGSSNNNWLNIIEEFETHIVVEFQFRYDKDFNKERTTTELMLCWFDFVEVA